jgi:hypothetical protein
MTDARDLPRTVTALDSRGDAADPSGPESAAGAGQLERAVDWLLVLWISALAGWAALLGIVYLPLHIGTIPLPISAAIGVAAMWWGPRACYRLTGSLLAAFTPAAAWFGVSVWLVLTRNTILGGVPFAVATGQWRVMVLLGFGSLAAAASIGLVWGDRLKTRLESERAGPGDADPPG